MIKITDKVDCCGCNACGDICNHQAITFKTDIEGFWYPEVDMDKCTDCHLCEKVCPVINVDKLKKNEYKEPSCFAANNTNIEVRFKSTSGGLFSVLADKMYRDKGYVGGAIFGDNDFNVVHYISNDKSDLAKLRKSKYKQSCLETFYLKVKSLLRNNEKVLVCGSPCQMAGLRSFLGNKDYENLLIVDYVCRGINSPKMDQKFREYLEQEEGSKIIYYKAKDKELGWHRMSWKFKFENGHVKYIPASVNLFTIGYLKTGAFCRPSCYQCKFKGIPRIADITLADCWGIDKINPEMDDDIGTSLVMINNDKGKRYFEEIKNKIISVQVPFESVVVKNPAILKSLPMPGIDRRQMFLDADNMDFKRLADKYFFPSLKVQSKGLKGSVKSLKKRAKTIKGIYKLTGGCIGKTMKVIGLNLFNKNIVGSDFKKGNVLKLSRYTVCNIDKGGKLLLNAPLSIGKPLVKNSRQESKLVIKKGAVMEVNCNSTFSYGCDIQLFKGARLVIKSDFGGVISTASNVGLVISCANRIEIGEGVKIGRNVTIRDNNGEHYIAMKGYKTSKPVVIGNHVWLCESCTIMQGVKIGDGAIIGAHSVVYNNVPPFSIVSGNPAKVVDTDVYWKY